MPDSIADAEFVEQFDQESDRGAALICAALLDEQLRSLIAAFLIEDESEVEELLGSESKLERPLSHFSARIRAAYCLGLISEDERHDLTLIRRIRNDFAHDLDSSSFTKREIADRCRSFRLAKERQERLAAFAPVPARQRFLLIASLISISLKHRPATIEIERRRVRAELDSY